MNSRVDRRTPAVVVGDGINGLGVLRSLGRAGVPVALLGSNYMQPAMYSRYGKKVLCSFDDPDRVISALVDLSKDYPGIKPILFLTQENVVQAVSEQRERLSAHYQFTLPETAIFNSLLHKDGFHSAAVAAGAPVPRSIHITDVSELYGINELTLPLVIKPSYHHTGYSSIFQKAYRIECVTEAHVLVKRILSTLPDVMVQEWIEGKDSDIYFCLQYRSINKNYVSFTGRKLRSWPPNVGGTASCTAAPAEAEELERLTTDFFSAAGVVGMASMEFKRDANSGRFMMVEPTVGRTDYQEEVATLNGINIPYAAYLLELGRDVPKFRTNSRPVVWRDSIADRQSAAITGSAVEVNGAKVADALWRWSDPGPKGVELGMRVNNRINALLRQLGLRGRAEA